MKNLFLSIVCLTALSCQKTASEETGEISLVASKNTIKKGESVDVTIRNPLSGSYAKWTVSPATGVAIQQIYTPETSAGNSIQFGQQGDYEIRADVRVVHPDCRPSPGWDTCFANVASQTNLTYKIKVME